MKRILSVLLMIAMILSLAPMAMAEEFECSWGDECPSKGYSDLAADAWYHEYIDMMIMAEVMIGTSETTFDPNGSLTRAQAAVLFHRTLKEEQATEPCTFTDVVEDAWYADGVAYMQQIGLIKGMGNDTFAPDMEFTREQYAVVMLRLSEFKGWYHPAPDADLADFDDGAKVSDWAKDAMLWAISEGIIKGDDQGNLNPTVPTRRCEAATVFVRLAENAQDYVVPDAVVGSEEELRAAVAEGGKIALKNNIEMDADNTIIVASGKKVELLLGGKTLSGTSDQEGNANREMFLVKGEMTVKDGAMTMIHTASDMGWNGMTTLFDVTAGGVLNIEDANISNLGGSAMTFGVHLNNWGKVTLNVEGSAIDATYCAVRVFNSGFDMNNVSIYNSELRGGSMAFWVHNYIGDLDSSTHSDEAIVARMNFDLFNGTNDLNGGKYVVRYGFGSSCLVLDAEGNVLNG